MKLFSSRCLAVAALSAGCVVLTAQTSTPATKTVATTTDPYRDEPFVFERLDSTTTMKADGTGDVISHVILRVQTEGVARQCWKTASRICG